MKRPSELNTIFIHPHRQQQDGDPDGERRTEEIMVMTVAKSVII